MNFDDELPDESTEIGSDELLSDDHLRLPESASPLVRLHAIRSWLTRREKEMTIEIGEAALALQHALQQESQEMRPRRRERQGHAEQIQHAQQKLTEAQQHLSAYEEAQSLLEECIAHTTSGERVLVEYYLTLENIAMSAVADEVRRRVETVCSEREEYS